ncbi:MAG: sulfotransferase [Bacteroidetes bacterium]|jgi:hypothetical protein|nr:sulfotransferase [Bacteroidota bacterium]MBT6686693.1 sulfotransferase [Bacteroidota bacterium]MBT7141831.1 sulfotransferase [Bacteroidota bacterium]MBT7490678.1 sulfotransferase [Bacteroidota bacterium]
MDKLLNKDDVKSLPFFFIIGRPRSGTTLIRTLLDAHPNVSIPIESPVIMYNSLKYNNITNWSKEDILNFYNDVLATRRFHKWTVDREKLKKDLLACEGEVTYFTLCKIVYLNYISFYEKGEITLVGDKNPLYSINVPRLIRLFPNAKYIHITRDYRDHILSMKRTQLYNSSTTVLAYRWKFSAKLINELKKKYPNHFFSFRYEDLVENTVDKLKEVCKFLNIEYEASVLDFYKIKDEVMRVYGNDEEMMRFNSNVYEPIDPKRLYLWKDKMQDNDIKTAELVIGKYAQMMGYDPKFKNFNILLYIKLLPNILFLKIVYFLTYLKKRLPLFIRKRLKK